MVGAHLNEGKIMKYICLGYIDEKKIASWSEKERNNFVDECFAYDSTLRKNGHFVGGEALQPAGNAVTLRPSGHNVSVVDGPFAETKEQIGGLIMLEARDFNHAIQLMSKHPSIFLGGGMWEIRPAADLSEMVAESERRQTVKVGN